MYTLTAIMLHSPGRQINTWFSSCALCYKAKECLTLTASLCWVGSLQTWTCSFNAVWNILLHIHYSPTLYKQWFPATAYVPVIDMENTCWIFMKELHHIYSLWSTFSAKMCIQKCRQQIMHSHVSNLIWNIAVTFKYIHLTAKLFTVKMWRREMLHSIEVGDN